MTDIWKTAETYYGLEYGNKIIKEIKHLISMKEEDLITFWR